MTIKYKMVNGVTLEMTPEEVAERELDEIHNSEKQRLVQYIYDRKVAYGDIELQLDMMYWDKVNGTESWKAHIEKVKSDIPKPGDE